LTKKLDKHEQRITADKRLKGAFDNLVAALMSDESGDEADWDTLAGTPTLRKAGQWDNSALTANLIGHVALALSGVVKWVFASWYEHLFAIRAVSALLAPGKCPNPLETQVVAIRELISKAEFYWAPEDHHDHWHVVFAKANDPRHSLGPTPYVIDAIEPKLINWIRLWDALGVEFFPAPEAQPTLKPMFKQQLATREIQGHFPDAAKEKDDIVKELTNFETEVRRLSKDAAQARMTLRKQALDLVVSAIAAAKWSDIPSLADNPSYQDWVKNSQLYKDHKLIIPKGCRLDKWVPWPSDTDPLRPEELPPDSDTATDVA